jgi:hypothetical protein
MKINMFGMNGTESISISTCHPARKQFISVPYVFGRT